jgi:P27 family predicted phage terminase small subunit
MAGNRNSGRRPKPTALKVLAGNPGKRPLNQDEPKAPAAPPVKPDGLSARADAAWDREAQKCVEMATLTSADEQAFATLCELIATRELIAAEKSAPEFKLLVQEATVDHDGDTHLKVRENPLLRMERQTASTMRAYLQMFGLDASSRSRIKAPSQKPANRLKAFLGGAAARA